MSIYTGKLETKQGVYLQLAGVNINLPAIVNPFWFLSSQIGEKGGKMAKGVGWAMATVLGGLKVAHLAGQVIVCPICGGPMTVGTMTEQFKCCSERDADMPEWLQKAIRDQGYSPWDYYYAVDIGIVAANGVRLTQMREAGQFGGWQWDGVPEGEVQFPDCFPIEKRDSYVEERFQGWRKEFGRLLEDPDCPSREELEAEEHIVFAIQRARRVIEAAAAKREADKERAAQERTDQECLDKALREDGFFDGRKGRAVIPNDALVLSYQSHGDRRDPLLLVVSSSLNFDQLANLVEARGDFSCLEIRGQTPTIVTPNPGFWIGRGGKTVKALGDALANGLGKSHRVFIKVVESE